MLDDKERENEVLDVDMREMISGKESLVVILWWKGRLWWLLIKDLSKGSMV